MSIINMVKTIKEIHSEDIILIKNGKFYNVYGHDSFIISYLFGYKLQEVENIKMCGFPINSLNKIIAMLEDKKINYLIIDRKNNYEIEEKSDNKKLNKYLEYYKRGRVYVNYRERIDNINHFMLKNIDKENFKNIIRKMEEIINEGREVSSN